MLVRFYVTEYVTTVKFGGLNTSKLIFTPLFQSLFPTTCFYSAIHSFKNCFWNCSTAISSRFAE